MAETPALRMPEPPADKVPLKVNVYEFARVVAGTLTPLFPYFDQGSIVPTVALFYGGDDGDYAYFIHDNTVDEVAIIFGAGDATRRGVSGLVRVSEHTHGVGNLLADPENPASFSFVTLTQRQSFQEQREAVSFACEKCSAEVYKLEYDSTPPARGRQREAMGPIGHLDTVLGSAQASINFNSDEKLRVCPKCGHQNSKFPLARWGWKKYAQQTDVVRRARAAVES